MRKKGDNPLLENVIFIVIVIVFFIAMFYFVARAGTGANFYEQKYAKKIALIVNSAKPGTTVVMDISDIIGYIMISGVGKPFVVEQGKVTITLEKGKGYDFPYYSDYKINVKREQANLILEIKNE